MFSTGSARRSWIGHQVLKELMGDVQTAAEESGVLGLVIQVTDGDTKGPVCPQILQGPLVSCMLETKALESRERDKGARSPCRVQLSRWPPHARAWGQAAAHQMPSGHICRVSGSRQGLHKPEAAA